MTANTNRFGSFITVYLESNLLSTCSEKSQQNCPLTKKVLHQKDFNGWANAYSQKEAPSSGIDQEVLNTQNLAA